MRIRCTTGGACASRIVVTFGAIALLAMAASGADQGAVQARSVDPNRPVRAHGPGTIDLSRTAIPRMAYAATRSGVAEGALPCTQPAGNCQLPDQTAHGEGGIIGATSDAVAAFQVFEGFRNDDASPMIITEVCWWGFYLDFDTSTDCNSEILADDFTITLFLNDPGCPTGAPDFAGPSQVTLVGNTAIRAPTGLLVGGNIEYEYSAQGLSIGPIPAGTCYWLGIQNNTPGTPSPNCLWLWNTSPGDTEGACFEANATPGCDDECCCTVVCVDLPFCCISPWVTDCAIAALSIGCTSLPPLPLCQDVVNCQVYGDLNAFNSTGDPGPAADLFHAADDFTVAAPGEITSLCFQGVYDVPAVTDSFISRSTTISTACPAA